MTSASPINSGDIQLANASQGQIVSFNQEPSEAVIAQSKRLGNHLLPFLVPLDIALLGVATSVVDKSCNLRYSVPFKRLSICLSLACNLIGTNSKALILSLLMLNLATIM